MRIAGVVNILIGSGVVVSLLFIPPTIFEATTTWFLLGLLACLGGVYLSIRGVY